MSKALVQDELRRRALYLVKTQGVDIDDAMDRTSIKERARGRRWLQSNVCILAPSEGGVNIFYWSNHLPIYQENGVGRVLNYWPSAIEVILLWFRNIMILDDLASIADAPSSSPDVLAEL